MRAYIKIINVCGDNRYRQKVTENQHYSDLKKVGERKRKRKEEGGIEKTIKVKRTTQTENDRGVLGEAFESLPPRAWHTTS